MKKIFVLIFFFSFVLYGQSQPFSQLEKKSEKTAVDVAFLKEIIVFDEGRIKPLDSFARVELLILNGKSTMTDSSGKKLSAIQWLARVMFTPSLALHDRVIKIVFPQVLEALGMSPNDSRRYSFNEIALRLPQLERLASFAGVKEQQKRDPLEREFLRIYDRFIRFYRIMNSFLFALPTETFRLSNLKLVEKLGLPPRDSLAFSYLDFMNASDNLFRLTDIAEQKLEKKRTAEEFILIEFKNRYQSFPESYAGLPHLIFPSFSHGAQKWFSPWQIFLLSSNKNLVKNEIQYLKNFVEAYRVGDQKGFDENVRAFLMKIEDKLSADNNKINRKVDAEIIYNWLDPFFRAMLLYLLASLIIASSVLFKNRQKIQKIFCIGYFFPLGSGFALHIGGILLRMFITDRPPITNLYTTFIFVALIFILFCLILHCYEKGIIALFSGPFSAFLMLLISAKFATEGDTMEVLIAVLRSNFWLSTHVITINLGYAGIIFSGVMAHIYLFLCLGKKSEDPEAIKRKRNVYSMIYAIQAFGLIFTVVGTLLGGIWADQSWGRFWGWDPKENGSLMIVLWSSAIFHARFSGMVREVGFAAGAVLGIVVVMIAWFGINLLGVGLHSYGFTEGILYPFFLYIGLQIVLLSFLLYVIYQRKLGKNLF